MNIELSPEAEMRLTDEARRRQVSVGMLVERLVGDSLVSTRIHGPGIIPTLPAFDLGAAGSLHRRDIYDDAD